MRVRWHIWSVLYDQLCASEPTVQHRGWIVGRAGDAGACTAWIIIIYHPDSKRHRPQRSTTATRKEKLLHSSAVALSSSAILNLLRGQQYARACCRNRLSAPPPRTAVPAVVRAARLVFWTDMPGTISMTYIVGSKLRHSSRAPPVTTPEHISSSGSIVPAVAVCLHTTPTAYILLCKSCPTVIAADKNRPKPLL